MLTITVLKVLKRDLFAGLLIATFSVSMTGCGLLKNLAADGRGKSIERHVVLVSIDGLRPDFYLSNEYDAPTLKKLAASGIAAEALVPIFPTLTYPNHTTMVTGVESARHGVLSNQIFNFDTGPTTDWYFDSKFIKVPTLWEKVHSAGKTVAIVRWPVTVGAQVDWLVPEIFTTPGYHFELDWALIKKNTQPQSLIERLQPDANFAGFKDFSDVDDFTVQAAAKILVDHHPNLTLIHLLGLDAIQHKTGRASAETRAELRAIDEKLKKIVDAADLSKTVIIVVGDHGFLDSTKTLDVNVYFARRGWLKDNQVVAQTDGGQAVVYTKNKSLDDKVLRVLRRNTRGRYKVLVTKQLEALGAYPEALCVLEAEEGYAFGPGRDPDAKSVEVDTKIVHGVHGHLPTRPELSAGFVAAGSGIDQPSRIKTLRMVNLAPMIARILGVDAPNARPSN